MRLPNLTKQKIKKEEKRTQKEKREREGKKKGRKRKNKTKARKGVFIGSIYCLFASSLLISTYSKVKVEDIDAYAPKDLLIVTTGSQVSQS